MPAGHDISSGADAFIRIRALEFDAAANSTTTGVEITGLQLDSVGPGIYIAEYFLVYQTAATTTGSKFGINHTGTVSAITAHTHSQEATTAASTGAASQVAAAGTLHSGSSARSLSTTAPNLGGTLGVDAINSNMLVVIEAVLVVTAVGDLELWQASEVAASSTTVKAGSSVRLTKAA